MGKKVEENQIVEKFFRRNDPQNIKSMKDMYAARKDFLRQHFNNC